MKKHTLGHIGALTLTLCLITTCLLSGTLAKYTTTVTGTGTAAVAKWSFKAGKTNASASDTFSFTLAETKTTNPNVATDVVAPGDKGKIDIVIDASGSQVAVDYTIALDKTGLTSTNSVIEFYSDKDYTTKITGAITDSIAFASVGTKVTVPIYWKWVTANEGDAADTTLGAAAASETFTVTVTGTQKTS